MLSTSIYCLLAFFPYTYYALIKSPAYDWMPWFAHHQALLYWLALIAVAGAYCKDMRRLRPAAFLLLPLAVAGAFVTARPFLPGLISDGEAYGWSVAALVPVLLLAAVDLVSQRSDALGQQRITLTYLPAVLSAITVAVLSMFGQWVQDRGNAHSSILHSHETQVGSWSVITHVVVALVVVSMINLLSAAAAKTARPRLVRGGTISLAVMCGGVYSLASFLDSALGFRGWLAWLYSFLLIATLLLLAIALVLPLLERIRIQLLEGRTQRRMKVLLVLSLISIGALALILPSRFGYWDWNGMFQWVFTVLLWSVVTTCFYFLSRTRAPYSWPAIAAVLLLALSSYKILQFGDVVWAKSLGVSDDDIARSFEQYASQDLSFRFAHHLLGNAAKEEPCEEFCRILRSYTNIRGFQTSRQIDFVDSLAQAPSKRPNIFIIVVDSLRPDFLGPYNPRVDFTPNIDALAKDSLVFRNAYTQYAGTSLSEPALWSGAMLLHAHYLQPFRNVNGLEKLVHADGYKMIVSYDNILPDILSSQDDLIKLDTDKRTWKSLDLCSTVTQFTAALDTGATRGRPLFFYAQPQNVHMFASNNHPTWRNATWKRPGFDRRISLEVQQTDDCLGGLLAYLKSHGLYDESIIILTSDHGDATGEFGRRMHSYLIYPEVMRVPLIVHLPSSMRGKFVYDLDRISTLTDITPSLYYLLGHRPIKHHPMLGQSMFAETKEELDRYQRAEVFLASDSVAVYGILDNGRYMYATYAYPARSFLFDLAKDPNAERNILTDELKRHYDQRVIDNLKMIGDYYGYKIGINSLLTSQQR
ncbi:MAG TPA: sulfatase-like hydrolase/transferase [Candidatus Angelobacter sp.]|nr:sulfatase-like hydrolase/transferase [Candidatus Angelobacter sp.]